MCQSGWLKYNKSLKNHLNFSDSFSHTGKKVYEVQIQGPGHCYCSSKQLLYRTEAVFGLLKLVLIKFSYLYLFMVLYSNKSMTQNLKKLGSCHLFTAYFIDFTKLPKTPHISNNLFTYRKNDKGILLCVFSVQFSDQTNLEVFIDNFMSLILCKD